MLKPPLEYVSLRAEEGERLIAQVHQSELPAAVTQRLEQIIRTCFWLVFALQETKITLSRLRRLLFGKTLKGSPPSSEESAPASGDELSAGEVIDADGGEVAAIPREAPPGPEQSPARGKAKGGHRPGTGRLGADADVGAERIACPHEELAVGQRCPVCGQGT